MKTDLSKYDNSWYDPGRGALIRTLWYFVNIFLVQNPLNLSSKIRVTALRLFGAKIAKGVCIKPGVNAKYPWNIEIGDYSSIGENAWLDSLAPIKIGSNCCISQGTYLCTGNHDWKDPSFGLIVEPITVKDGGWLGARSVILPGVTIESHSVVAAGSVISKDTEAYMVYAGNPAVKIKERIIREEG